MRYLQYQYLRKLRRGKVGSSYANNAVGPDNLHEVILDRALGVALGVGLNVAEITDVTLLVRGRAVALAVGVDYNGQTQGVSSTDRPGGRRGKGMPGCRCLQ